MGWGCWGLNRYWYKGQYVTVGLLLYEQKPMEDNDNS